MCLSGENCHRGHWRAGVDGREAAKSWQQILKLCEDLLGNCCWLHRGQKLFLRAERGPSAERHWRRAQAALLAAISISCCTQMELAEEFVGMEKFILDWQSII